MRKHETTSTYYEGEDISKNISLLVDKESKKAVLNIDVDGKWTVYSGNSVETIDFSTPLREGYGSGDYELEASSDSRHYYQVVTEKGKAVFAENHLPLDGCFNFRDLGGIMTTEGRYVKWGKLFRSDDLSQLSDKDLNYLTGISLISIVDFRTESEKKSADDRKPSSVKEMYAYSITAGNLSNIEELFQMTEAEATQFMIDMNQELVSDPAAIKQFKEMFALLQNEEHVPLVFHCSAGKDRTGMAATLILYALGVDEETIRAEYLLSNQYLSDKYAPLIAEHSNAEPVFVVKEEYLQAGIDLIKEQHSSVEEFLTDSLNVNIPKFRDIYLY